MALRPGVDSRERASKPFSKRMHLCFRIRKFGHQAQFATQSFDIFSQDAHEHVLTTLQLGADRLLDIQGTRALHLDQAAAFAQFLKLHFDPHAFRHGDGARLRLDRQSGAQISEFSCH